MPFIRVKGLSGQVYVPQVCPTAYKKHPCRDCFDCQRCSDDRCSLCRSAECGQGREANTNHAPKTPPR